MITLSTHILDTALGKPASQVQVLLEQQSAQGWLRLAERETDADGRVSNLTPEPLPPGRYRLTADLGCYFARTQRDSLYPCAQIDFVIPANGSHYHLPFLISPWSWSTYRGS